MGKREQSRKPKWILMGTGILGLLAAALVVVVRYYEIKKASAEAEQASIAAQRARAEAEEPKQKSSAPEVKAPPRGGSIRAAESQAPGAEKSQEREGAKSPPDPIVAKWVEKQPGTPVGDRIRTFKSDGTLILYLPKSQQTTVGTWRREGNKIFFHFSSLEGWFTVVSINSDELVLLMDGQRQYTWFRSS